MQRRHFFAWTGQSDKDSCECMETAKSKKVMPKSPGRKKGVPNKNTKALKDMILQALGQAGGVDYLATQAQKNPKAFLALLGRVLPLQVTGEGGGPVHITFTAIDAKL